MQYSGLQVLAWMLLLVGTGALVASFATDYWSVHEAPVVNGKSPYYLLHISVFLRFFTPPLSSAKDGKNFFEYLTFAGKIS